MQYSQETQRLAPLANEPERAFEERAWKHGWATSKRGWPDFVCLKDGEIMAVEVKPRLVKGDGYKLLSREQAEVMDALERHGIPCYISDGERLERYDRSRHAPESRRSPRGRARRRG